MLLFTQIQAGALLKEVERRAWKSLHLVTGAPTRKPRRPGTAAYYSQCIARIVETWPGLVSTAIHTITADDCAEWAERHSELFCPEAFNGALLILHAVFAIAKRRGQIDEDPTLELQPAIIPDRKWTLPNDDQWRRALQAMNDWASNTKQPHRNRIHQVYLARWLAATGMRPRASVELRIHNVNFTAATVHLAAEFAKNGKDAVLPLSKAAVEVAREAAGTRQIGDRLFLTTSARGALRAASAVIGVKLNHRTMRQRFASLALECAPPSVAAKLLTHQDGGETLLKHYDQWRVEPLVEALQRMEQRQSI